MILLDTGPLVALCEPRDALNRAALRDLDRASRELLILCAPVLTEAFFLLPHPVQRRRLRRMLDELSVRAYKDDDEGRLWGGLPVVGGLSGARAGLDRRVSRGPCRQGPPAQALDLRP